MNDDASLFEIETKPEAPAAVPAHSTWAPPVRRKGALKVELGKARQVELPLTVAKPRLCIGVGGGKAFHSLSESAMDRGTESLRERSFTLNPRFQ